MDKRTAAVDPVAVALTVDHGAFRDILTLERAIIPAADSED